MWLILQKKIKLKRENMLLFVFLCFLGSASFDDSYISYNPTVPCDGDYIPDNCGFPNVTLDRIKTLEDFDRCAPAVLPKSVRNFYWAGAGRKVTYRRNFEAIKRESIIPHILRDVSRNHLHTTLLGSKTQLPIGISPTLAHKLANPVGEIGTARAAASVGAVMVLNSYSTATIEDVAQAAFSVNENAVLWMHTYIYRNRNEVLQIVRRAENSGFKALVVTVDSPVGTHHSCSSDEVLRGVRMVNFLNGADDDSLGVDDDSLIDASLTFKDLTWLRMNTKLPIVAKGILTGYDAIRAAESGVSAVFVSNQGGRQLEASKATIEVLAEVVRALRTDYPGVEVYMDSGVRNGWDVFKVLSKGAKAAFVGRPAIWGLAIAGERGVEKMLTILRAEFNESMLVAGYSSPTEIQEEAIRAIRYSI